MGVWHNKTAILLFGIGFSLILWGSGLDWAIQAWLVAHYDQNFNNLTRFLGWLGLGRTQIMLTLGLGTGLALRWFANGARTVRYSSIMDLVRRWRAAPLSIRVWFYTLPVFVVAGVLSIILKMIVGRPRPKEVLWNNMPYGEMHPIWQHGHFKASLMSWPSGHSASTFAIGTLLMLAFPKHKYGILLVMTVLAAARFLALTPHYLGDVVAGAALGACVALTMAPRFGMTARK